MGRIAAALLAAAALLLQSCIQQPTSGAAASRELGIDLSDVESVECFDSYEAGEGGVVHGVPHRGRNRLRGANRSGSRMGGDPVRRHRPLPALRNRDRAGKGGPVPRRRRRIPRRTRRRRRVLPDCRPPFRALRGKSARPRVDQRHGRRLRLRWGRPVFLQARHLTLLARRRRLDSGPHAARPDG